MNGFSKNPVRGNSRKFTLEQEIEEDPLEFEKSKAINNYFN